MSEWAEIGKFKLSEWIEIGKLSVKVVDRLESLKVYADESEKEVLIMLVDEVADATCELLKAMAQFAARRLK